MRSASSSDERQFIRAHDFRRIKQNGITRICCRLDSDVLPEQLWFDVYGHEVDSIAVEEPNWAAIALIFPAMMCGRNLVIDANISPRLLHALNGDLKGLLLAFDPHLKPVNIEAGCAPLPLSLGSGVAAGFSAGIDSFATLLSYSNTETPKPLRLTHLTLHNVGALGRTPRTSNDRAVAYENACLRTALAAKEFGLGAMCISSNIEDLFGSFRALSGGFEHTHSLRDVAVAHVLHDSLNYFLYSSNALTYEDIGVSAVRSGHVRDMGSIDPILLPLLSTERLTILSAGASLSRAQKTSIVAKSHLARRLLDVCSPTRRVTKDGLAYNCSRCKKCVRTMATLEALGELDNFDYVFDVDSYKANRTSLLRRLNESARSGDYLAQEVASFFCESGLRLPAARPKAIIKLHKIFRLLALSRAAHWKKL